MFKPSSVRKTLRWITFLLVSALTLSGCSLLSNGLTEDTSTVHSTKSFTLEVQAPREVRTLLLKYMELQRYGTFEGLRPSELRRLLGTADANIRSLLGTIGYFSPAIEIRLIEAPAGPGTPPAIIVQVDPGPITKVNEAHINFSGVGAEDSAGARMRRQLERNWGLGKGQDFTQSVWSNAKSDGLRYLQERRYPTASIANSSADIDTDTNQANLTVDYAPGPAYYFGPLVIEGAERYNPAGFIRLAQLPVEKEYTQAALLDAQQRLANSGYFDSVFLTLATDVAQSGEKEVHAPVIAEVREAKLQKWVYGIGASTDSGIRFSVDHIHNSDPFLNWRAVSKLQLESKFPEISTRLTSLPDYTGWNYFVGGKAAREKLADYSAKNISLTYGRGKSEPKIDRSYYLQYDLAKPQGDSPPPSSSAISANYSWTGRYFNNLINPTFGYGLGWEFGAGSTLTPSREPFFRINARWQRFIPLERDASEHNRRGRIMLRANGGAVIAHEDAVIPVTLLFLAGGDNSVRGYSYQSIGARSDGQDIIGGRYLATGSVSWLRPITIAGNYSDWEQAVFVDAGTVTDSWRNHPLYVGVGTGVRWKSPVGPLQVDLAYGLKTSKIMLHLRLGFNF